MGALGTGAIIGIVAGALCVVVHIFVCIAVIIKKRNQPPPSPSAKYMKNKRISIPKANSFDSASNSPHARSNKHLVDAKSSATSPGAAVEPMDSINEGGRAEQPATEQHAPSMSRHLSVEVF